LSPNVNQGKILMGGAIFDPQPSSSSSDSSRGDITGSAMLFAFDTREEVVELLKSDIYAKNGVWDVENVKLLNIPILRNVTDFITRLQSFLFVVQSVLPCNSQYINLDCTIYELINVSCFVLFNVVEYCEYSKNRDYVM